MRSPLVLAATFAAIVFALVHHSSQARAEFPTEASAVTQHSSECDQPADSKPTGDHFRVYIGTYTQGTKSEGIYLADFDAKSGRLSHVELAARATNPSFLAIHPSGKFLYAVGETEMFNKSETGSVSAFAIDTSGKLTAINHQASKGRGPCHIVCDAHGKHVLVANYGGGSAAALPIHDDGALAAATGFSQHQGSSVNKSRQEAPHAHSINLDHANRFAFVADLGLDQILVYAFDTAAGTLTPHSTPFAPVAKGAGPRHFAFHPSGKRAYVINELNSTVTAFSYDADSGRLTETQAISTLPKDFQGNNYPAEVVVHPSGKFVYGSNRGHNSLAIFKVGDDGQLTAAGHATQHIKNPRNFVVDPTGRFVLCGSQDSDVVVVFAVDQESGALTPVGEPVAVAKPVCLRFLAKPASR